jgi:hypothetical protein
MKKYFFVFNLCSILATVACETTNKGTVSQVASKTQPETVAIPVAVVADSAVTLMPDKRGVSKKAKMQHAEIVPMSKAEMQRKAEDKPVKNN